MMMTHPRHGISLVLVLVVLFAFVAVFPLLTAQIDNGFHRGESQKFWMLRHSATETALRKVAASVATAPVYEKASYSLGLGLNATFVVDVCAWRVPGIPPASPSVYAQANTLIFRAGGGVASPAGFAPMTLMASITSSPAILSSWRSSSDTFRP